MSYAQASISAIGKPINKSTITSRKLQFGNSHAGNAAEARAALAALGQQPLVVVLDLRLPDSVDLGLLAEIRKRYPHAPVVMMSAHGTSEDVKRAGELGACRFVEKPFDVTELVKLVGEAWESRT